MSKFTNNLKRKINAVYKPKSRQSRPNKLRIIRQDVEDALSTSPSDALPSPETPKSKEARSNSYDNDNVEARSEAQKSPESDDQRGIYPTETTDGPVDSELTSQGQPQSTVDEIDPAGLAHDVADQDQILQQAEDLETGIEDAGMIRYKKYITFRCEDESDYTEGPPRMILTSDGVKPCVGLLMTLPLSTAIQQAITSQRRYAKMRSTATERTKLYSDFSSELEDEIRNHELRIMKQDGDESQIQSLQEEVNILQLTAESNHARLMEVENSLRYAEQSLRAAQEDANAQLEDAFVCALLMEPEDSTPVPSMEPLDLRKEFQETVRQVHEMNGGSVVEPSNLDTSRDHMLLPQEPLTPEQQREQDLQDAIWLAQQRHDSAQAAFDHRESDRLDEYSANAEAAALGEATLDASPEAFDLRWVQKIQELTRELIEAESALSAAKVAAMEAGIDVPMDDRASGFVDDVADGYRMSMEQAMIGSVPSPTIKDWVNGIPEVASPSFNEHANEADEWEAEDVEISDSVSMVAQDAGERRRIDKWRQVCGL